MERPIWEGVYKDFSEVPTEGKGHYGEKWIQNSLKKISRIRELARKEGTIPPVTAYRESLLPFLASIVYAESGGVKILDFGGSLGFTYYQVLKGLPESENLEFHIAEIDEVCNVGRNFFNKEKHIYFHSGLPSAIKKVDIVHIGSSLQYVEDWRGMLSSLCEYNPTYVLFTDLPSGDITTYASAQYYYGSKMPCWFFNVKEVMAWLDKIGYRNTFRGSYASIILNKEQPYPQENFDEKHRIGYAGMLCFKRKEE